MTRTQGLGLRVGQHLSALCTGVLCSSSNDDSSRQGTRKLARVGSTTILEKTSSTNGDSWGGSTLPVSREELQPGCAPAKPYTPPMCADRSSGSGRQNSHVVGAVRPCTYHRIIMICICKK